MVAQLEIFDGVPWYLSPDIWVTPDDPTGPPGMPVAGDPAYVWTRVHNTGDAPAIDATVTFYWANPSIGFDRTTATKIGTANVSLNPGANTEVLCLTAWVPTFVNDGHECLLAEVFQAGTAPMSTAFDVPSDNRVAQRNLAVLATPPRRIAYFAFEVHNPDRVGRVVTVRARPGELAELRALRETTGLDDGVFNLLGEFANPVFVSTACPDPADLENAPGEVRHLELKPGQRVGFSLAGRLAGDAALMHVEQILDDQVVGGLAVLFLTRKD